MKKLLTYTPKQLKLMGMKLYSTQIVLSNYLSLLLGAAVYFDIEKFDECMVDCNKAIEVNPTFIKVY
jgi:hypothetical protein